MLARRHCPLLDVRRFVASLRSNGALDVPIKPLSDVDETAFLFHRWVITDGCRNPREILVAKFEGPQTSATCQNSQRHDWSLISGW